MNLYRSFGNLMEAWVTEGNLHSDSQSLGNNEDDSPAPSSDMGTNLRSESVDSGVETASSDASFSVTSCFVSADNGEIDPFLPERDGDRLTPASTSQSPVLSPLVPSPSSLCCHSSRPQEGSPALHLKMEQALQRTDSKKDNSKPLTVEEVLRRQPRASFLPKRHTSELVRGQRSESVGLRRTANTSAPLRHRSQIYRRPASISFDKRRSERLSEEEERTGLSPGLSYLEHVCQMLEEIAIQRMHNQALQIETDALREGQDAQAPNNCQSDTGAAEEDLSSCQSLENVKKAEHSCTEPLQRKQRTYGHFRQRSASDTTIATLHLKKVNSDCRGQHLSTDDLLETTEEEHKAKESKNKESNKTNRNWNLKIGTLRRGVSTSRDTKSRQSQPSEKNSARLRLSQLFSRTRKTQPV